MEGSGKVLSDLVIRLSSLMVLLVTSPVAWIALGSLILFFVCIFSIANLRRNRLLSRAAGTTFGFGSGLMSIIESLGSMVGRLLISIPTLAAVLAAAIALAAVGESAARIEEAAAQAARIKELQGVLKNLERSIKVADVRILSTSGGITHLVMDFHDPGGENKGTVRKEFSIPGRDIYFDALVLNFDYSEIAQGRRVNIAIPYRIFSDEVAQLDGYPLGATDERGIPYIFHRDDEDVYGIAPDVYRSRLVELLELVKDEQAAREAGIIRSFYGSAVHTRVSPGDRFEIRIEQTGGLSMRERKAF